MGGGHGSAHYHTATLQMASITVECAELAVSKMSNVLHPVTPANSTAIHSCAQHDRHVKPLPYNSKPKKKTRWAIFHFSAFVLILAGWPQSIFFFFAF